MFVEKDTGGSVEESHPDKVALYALVILEQTVNVAQGQCEKSTWVCRICCVHLCFILRCPEHFLIVSQIIRTSGRRQVSKNS